MENVDMESIAQELPWLTVEPVHCHQRLKEHTLVEKIRVASPKGNQFEILHRFVPEELPFFFDHYIDHLPGMLELCAARQGAMAIAHLLHHVPIDYRMILHSMMAIFRNFGDLDERIVTKGKVLKISHEEDRIQIELEAKMQQKDYTLVELSGKMICTSPELGEILRKHKTR